MRRMVEAAAFHFDISRLLKQGDQPIRRSGYPGLGQSFVVERQAEHFEDVARGR